MKRILSKIKKTMCVLCSAAIVFSLPATAADNSFEKAGEEIFEKKSYDIVFDQPAADSIDGWKNSSLPLGNGYFGANVFGGTQKERIQITAPTLWTGASAYIENRYSAGMESFADIYINFDHDEKNVKNYRRSLNLDSAVAKTEYELEGVKYAREYFTSYPARVMAVKITADNPGALDFTVAPQISGLRTYLEKEGDGKGKSGEVKALGDEIIIKGNSQYYNIDYEGILKITSDAKKIESEGGKVKISSATEAVVYFSCATNYVMDKKAFEADVKEKTKNNPLPHETVRNAVDSAYTKGYDALKSEHIKDYGKYFSRAKLDLGGKNDSRTTGELIKSYKSGNSEPYLEELYFQMGRYMLIACSRENTLPAGLSGIWNAYEYAPWTGGFWYNINQQMNYWPAFCANLAEMYKPYAEFNKVRLGAAQKNADEYIKKYRAESYEEKEGANGWIVGTGNNPYSVAGVGENSHSGPGTGGFTTVGDADYYLYTKDKSVLNDYVYPSLEGMARFYKKCVDDYNGKYLCTISASPEQKVNGKAYQTVGCAFDQQMVYQNNRALLDIYSENKDILNGADEDLIKKIETEIDKYDPVLIGKSGQIKEYREEEYYGDIGEKNHRHISNLVGLYPGNVINEDETPAWIDSAKVTLKGRGKTQQTGWSEAHKLSLWARAKDADESYLRLKELISNHLFDNMLNKHDANADISKAVFQADANFGATAGICEMLLQSQGEFISILPAKPDEWQTGSFSGLCARGAFETDAAWNGGKLTAVSIKSKAGGYVKLQALGLENSKVIDADGKEVKYSVLGDGKIGFETAAGESYAITDIKAKDKSENVKGFTAVNEDDKTVLTWIKKDNTVYDLYKAAGGDGAYTAVAHDYSGAYLKTDKEDFAVYAIVAKEAGKAASGREMSIVKTAEIVCGNKKLSFDTDPVVINGRLLVPFRAVFEALGANVDFDEKTVSASAVLGEKSVKITLGLNTAEVCGKEIETDVCPVIRDNRFLVPLRLVSEGLGASVTWDKDNYRAVITPNQPERFYGGYEIKDAFSSGYANYEVAAFSCDGNKNTVWSAEGENEWICYDLGEVKSVGAVYVMWNKADVRKAKFEVLLSEDNENYASVFDGESAGNVKDDFEKTAFEPKNARYVKIKCKGNSQSKWNAVKEIKITG